MLPQIWSAEPSKCAVVPNAGTAAGAAFDAAAVPAAHGGPLTNASAQPQPRRVVPDYPVVVSVPEPLHL